MGEIPEDIMQSANEAYLRQLFDREAISSFTAGEFKAAQVRHIARALMAERERALKIVAEIVAESGMTHEHDGEGAIVENVCDDIANAIRNQSEN